MKDCTLDDMEKDDGLVFLEGTSEEVHDDVPDEEDHISDDDCDVDTTALNDTYGDSCCADQDKESRDERMESYSALQAEIGTQTDMNGFVQVGMQTDASESVQVHTVPVPVRIPSICYVPFQSQNKSKPYGTNIIQENDEATKFYTGLASWALFQFLLGFLVDKYPNANHKLAKLTPSDGLLMVLMRLRLQLPIEDLSYRFMVSVTTVCETFQKWIDVMHAHLQFLIVWPSHETVRTNMPQVFKDLYPHTCCIIDCSEVFIEQPLLYQARAKTYSNYKKHNTMKFLIGITPNGAISFLSKCWGGRATDKAITQKSGFLNLVEHGDVILADRGFDVADDLWVFGARPCIYKKQAATVTDGSRVF